jgi:ubiquinone/menaquinone biosynthesis C-methylase UbiE
MQSLITNDIYWGEFAESDMDAILAWMRVGQYDLARARIQELGRTNFVFGKQRSDFLYYLHLSKQATCLDIGCGLGVHTFNIAPNVGQVHAIDLSRKRAEFCELRATMDHVSNVSVLHTDVMHLPFEDKYFDNILMNGVLEWVPEMNLHADPRADQIEVLQKLKGLLKKEGRLYVGIENRIAFSYLTSARDHNRLKYTTLMPRFLAHIITQRKLGKSYRTYTYSKRGYEKLFIQAGFKKENIHIYLAHPGYNLPQYLIPFEDISALRFFMLMISSGSSWKMKTVRFLAQFDWFLRIARYGFYSFAIFADNE